MAAFDFTLRSALTPCKQFKIIIQRQIRATFRQHGRDVNNSLADQSVQDLLTGKHVVDKDHHLQGALLIPLESARDIVKMAAAVETRLTRGTKMNDTSSRSHCVTVFTLSVLEGENFRQSRLQFFDLMGSERFKGGNAAHDTSKSSKSSMSGWEGIYANFSLSSLVSAVEQASKQRRRKGAR